MPSLNRVCMIGLLAAFAAPADPSGANLPNPEAITVTGIYQPGTPCSRILRDDGGITLIPVTLHDIEPGARVTVYGPVMGLEAYCGAPALDVRGWYPARD